ncbi:hypothetical protein SAMN05216526_0655 [Ectothiorhodosinus mongolicus]|uniref:Uncharacterized protein n=1 Tax=Ectothiorhodosinus mongolicus TaxID=233100 RepID=A0A1R3VSJ1_9GAMM|nr:DsrE family protein [Ectothiorhodosinus mongolicus]ULX56646.1 peroxiredoxin [Ectothiorhodosinus mongolicus]SIT66640.1 hypothetical protein SAMN05216526_0655 [Ectothiorhodosinus mongolicus]
MAEKVVFMLVNTQLDPPTSLGTPFFQATVAAAMDLEVEMYFAAETVKLLKKGVAEKLYPGAAQEKSIYAFMQDAHELGVKFYACFGATDEHNVTPETAIPELDGMRGGGAFIGDIVEEGVIALTY